MKSLLHLLQPVKVGQIWWYNNCLYDVLEVHDDTIINRTRNKGVALTFDTSIDFFLLKYRLVK